MLKRLFIFATATSLSLAFICPAMVSAATGDDMYRDHVAMNNTVDVPSPACCVGMDMAVGQDRVAIESQSDLHIPHSIFQIPCSSYFNEPTATFTHPFFERQIRAPDPKFESSGLGKRE
jgi:hypothetical protein